MKNPAFSNQNSLAIKGVAILMMLWHHCFMTGKFENYVVDFWPLSQNQVVNIAFSFKICVSLFAFISGYGLLLSWQSYKKRGEDVSPWLREKLVRTLSGYWLVVILAWIACTILDDRTAIFYGFDDSKYLAIWKMCMDFLGVSHFFGIEPLLGPWWYMSAAVVFIFLVPTLNGCLEKVGCLYTACMVFILPRICGGYHGSENFLSFVPALCCGMIFAKEDLFAKWTNVCRGGTNDYAQKIWRTALLLIALILAYKLYYHLPNDTWWDVKWGILPVVVILFVYDVLIPIKLVNTFLVFVGKHATNIWLVHMFIVFYCQDFIYGQGHFLAVIGMLFLTSLGVSLVIELLKKITRYDALVRKLSGVRTKSPA